MIDRGGLLHERPFTREGNYLVSFFVCFASLDFQKNYKERIVYYHLDYCGFGRIRGSQCSLAFEWVLTGKIILKPLQIAHEGIVIRLESSLFPPRCFEHNYGRISSRERSQHLLWNVQVGIAALSTVDANEVARPTRIY